MDEVPDLVVELVAAIVEAGFTLTLEVALVDDPSFEAALSAPGIYQVLSPMRRW
jgi:hypothetical protein